MVSFYVFFIIPLYLDNQPFTQRYTHNLFSVMSSTTLMVCNFQLLCLVEKYRRLTTGGENNSMSMVCVYTANNNLLKQPDNHGCFG